MKADGVEVLLHVFSTLTLNGVEWCDSRLRRLMVHERGTGTHWTGGSVGTDILENRNSFVCSVSNNNSSIVQPYIVSVVTEYRTNKKMVETEKS
jgi:hypothetical protein